MNKTNRLFLATLVLVSASLAARAALVVVPAGSSWKYFIGTAEASSPVGVWRTLEFNDASWLSGTAPIGYGETVTTTLRASSSAPVYTSVFLRRIFTVADPANVTQIRFEGVVDDGLVVWINGVQVGSENAPATVTYNGAAPAAVEPHGVTFTVTDNLTTILLPGNNVLAVQFFNANTTSSDIYFDGSLSLIEPDPIPPEISDVSPAPGTLNQLTQVSVTFTEPVDGVDSVDLLVNGSPATSVVGAGANYTFFFPQPLFGTVQLGWSATHGIVDLGVPPNPFDHTAATANWQYQLVDIFPPTVTLLDPPSGATVRSLSQIQVQFSENVAGVNAADLLIKTQPATNLIVISPKQYIFEFPQPTTGTVAVAWAPGHDIRDLAAVPNSFAGGNWQYLLDPTASADMLFITEFVADNRNSLKDEDGDSSDWIEIHNAGAAVADLEGWYVTDDPADLTKWRFPRTNLLAGAYMIVWASEKDRDRPGEPLHTNFKLDKEGEFLALVRPDGVTIANAFYAPFAPQLEDVSYGLPTASAPTTLLTEGAPARLLVPTDGTLGSNWTFSAFDDSGWVAVNNGVGFEGSPGTTPNLVGAFQTDIGALMSNLNSSVFIRIPFFIDDPGAVDFLNLRVKYDDGYIAYINGSEVARRNAFGVVANSVTEFSGVQGSNNWYYGYYNKTLDADKTYQPTDFIQFAGGEGQGAWDGLGQLWAGSSWELNTASAGPWTSIGSEMEHPNGSNSGNEHWCVRRYVSEGSGTLTLQYRLSKQNTGGGNGVTGRIFHNGTLVFSRTIAYNYGDAASVTNIVSVPGVDEGDFIDFTLDATGTDGQPGDGSDGSYVRAVILLEEGLFPDWNIAATAAHPDGQATLFEDANISFALPGMGAGENILAIQGLNVGVSDNDFLAAVELETRTATIQTDQPRYFATPTPGAANGLGVDNLGPVLSELEHEPAVPLDNEDLVVRVQATPAFAPVGTVNLTYRVMYLGTTNLIMTDDGLGADTIAGDGIYSATIPAAAIAAPGQMIRWYVRASDSEGRISRLPPFEDPLNSPEFDGTIVYIAQTNNLPILHWFVQNPASAATSSGARCSVFYEGEFYDNVWFNIHGQSSQGGAFIKKSYDIDFHPGYNFLWKKGQARVDDLNLMTCYPDKAFMRNILAYNTYRDSGSSYHFTLAVRVQQNGVFAGIWHMMENGDDNWLERLGLDPNGALYKMYNTFTDPTDYTISPNAEAEKKTRKNEGSQDLQQLWIGVNTNNVAYRTNYIFDNVDIPGTIDFLAARIITGDYDCCHKNYYVYRDTEGNGEWLGMPWDVDLSFGRNWTSDKTYWNNGMFPDNYVGVGNNNGFFQKLIDQQPGRQMYLRRIRTLMDELLQPTNTPPHELLYEAMVDSLAEQLRPDTVLDLALNGTWIDTSGTRTFDVNHVDYETLDEAVARLKKYFPDRRAALYNRLVSGSTDLPNAQPANTVITFGTIEYNPNTGNQAHEYLELLNTNNYAVDISGWKLTNAVEFTFKPGTVIPAGGRLYVSPDVRAFRARPFSPRAGEGRFVQGNYDGQLSARGEAVALVHKDGHLIESKSYPSTPSSAQEFLRITEIMYHPGPVLPGETFAVDDYEYMELKNIGPQTIPLAGVHFTNGIAFEFAGSAVTSLGPHETVLIVRNQAAFLQRYGAGPNIAGQYTGQLDNGGERIRLDDGAGEKVLDFDYEDDWYPTTDGLGFSLVTVDETAPFTAWDSKTNWRPSGEFNGSPDAEDPAPVVVAPVLVNEVLTHTDFPNLDTVELLNTNTAPVDVGGWFLSDDFIEARKYRIPDDTIVPAGGYLLLDENQFNPMPGQPSSFSFSSKGDEVYLFSGNGTDLTGYFHGFDFGAAQNGVTFGRHITSIGEEHFVAQSATTFLEPNALPKVGPVVISELMYHPPDLADAEDNTDDEFIELHNISDAEVVLHDPAYDTNRWELRGAADYRFPTNAVLPAGGYLLVVSFDPAFDPAKLALFRSKFNVPAEVAVHGPYTGKLDNSAERVRLYRPDTPNPLEMPFEVPFILVDQVSYRDAAPWPYAADGYGPSLVREVDQAYGDDPANWRAAAPSAGRDSGTGTIPVITGQPVDAIGVLGQSATLTVVATGTAPLQYQWRFNGNNLPGANSASLTLPKVKSSDSGIYNVAVFNAAGAVLSSNAELQVVVPALILSQPASRNVLLGSNVTFSVQAVGPSAITYQWRKNELILPGETNNTLVLLGVQESDAGDYTVLITDVVATQVSDVATLKVLVYPSIVRLQTRYNVVEGGSVTLSVETAGTLPMGYRWRRGTATLLPAVLDSHVSFFTLNNVQTNQGGPAVRYTVILTNQAFYTPGVQSTPIILTVLPDVDKDGLPDSWETEHNAQDPNLDQDGDGMTNGEEYTAGTDPTDPDSYLRIEQLSINNGVQIEFLAISNQTYTVEFTDQLVNPLWQKLADVVARTNNAPVTLLDSNAITERHYRIVTPQQP